MTILGGYSPAGEILGKPITLPSLDHGDRRLNHSDGQVARVRKQHTRTMYYEAGFECLETNNTIYIFQKLSMIKKMIYVVYET